MTKLAFGVTFMVIAVSALFSSDDIDEGTAWLWAIAVGTLGVAGLVSAVGAIVQQSRDGRASRD